MVTSSATDPIFQPLTINGVTFKNRVFRSSVGGRADYDDGSMSEARIAWDRHFERKEFIGVLALGATGKPDLLYGLRSRRMTIPEILELVKDYARADGVEIGRKPQSADMRPNKDHKRPLV